MPSPSWQWLAYFPLHFYSFGFENDVCFLHILVVAGVAPLSACQELWRLTAGCRGDSVAGANKKNDCMQGDDEGVCNSAGEQM